jgi:F0F1-type ATP synthase assembly protein I
VKKKRDSGVLDRKMMAYGALGFEVIGFMVAGVYIGNWAEERFKGNGLYLVGCILVALSAFVAHVVLVQNKLSEDDSKTESKNQKTEE